MKINILLMFLLVSPRVITQGTQEEGLTPSPSTPLCPDPAPPANGGVTLTRQGAASVVARYSCEPGLRLVGAQTANCTLGPDDDVATFSPAPPTCRYELLPFGESAGDQVVPPRATSGPQPTGSVSNLTFPFFGIAEDTIFVNSNGIISFRESFTVSENTFSDPFPYSADILIAPFWDDFDNSASASNNGQILYRYSTNESLLYNVSRMIEGGFGCCFSPGLLLLATWDNVSEYFSIFSQTERNTFQAAIVTDGEQTYVIFLYKSIQWGTGETVIGFNAGDGEHSFALPRSVISFTPPDVVNTSNVGVPGMHIFRVDQESVLQPSIVVTVNGPHVMEEGVGEIEFELLATAGHTLQYAATIEIETVEGSATAGQDYNSTLVNITLSNTERRISFNISVMDDLESETNETFFIFLSVVEGPGNLQLTTQWFHVIINDNDDPDDPTVDATDHDDPTDDPTVDPTVDPTDDPTVDPTDDPTDVSVVLKTTDIDGSDAVVTDVTSVPMPSVEKPTVGMLAPSGINELVVGVSTTVAIIVSTVAIIIIIIAVICTRKIKRKYLIHRRTKKSKTLRVNAALERNSELLAVTVRSTLRRDVPKHLIVYSCNLQLENPVGQGEYGIVYRGRMASGFNMSFSQVVAVKTLKGFLENSLVEDLLQECSRMSDFNHPNVLNLLGVCLDGGPAPYLIMPFMFNGSLLSHLKEERNNIVLPPQQKMDSTVIAVSEKLLDICLQVAKGMKYLVSKMVVHRDLAARNCMIDMHFVIKVADFGLSETIDPLKNYIRQNTDGMKLPVKWLAPESLSDGIFSEKSDVWAFGVTCWEVFSGGMMPYPGINPVELPHMLQKGYRMEKPDNFACQEKMYNIITQCWAGETENRPLFSEVVTLLSEYLEGIAGYTMLDSLDSEHEYLDI